MLSILTTHTKNGNNNSDKGSRRTLWEEMDISMALILVMVSWMDTYPQTHRAVYIKYLQLFPCQPYLNKMVLKKCGPTNVCSSHHLQHIT